MERPSSRTALPRGTTLAALGLCACRGEPPLPADPAAVAARPSFVLLLPDSLRADRLDATRDGAAVAPAMRALADRGVRFDRAFSQAGWTMPALAAVMTGRYPVVPSADPSLLAWRAPESQGLVESLAIQGYHTVGFFGPNADALRSEYTESFTEEAQGGTAALARWLATGPPEPFLAVVHDVDLQFVAHTGDLADIPGAAAGLAALRRPREQDSEALSIGELQRIVAPSLGPEAAEERLRAAYDAVVARWDHDLAAVLAALDGSTLGARTVVILTSPHGHHLGEHRRFVHGTLHEPDLHVPLIWADGSFPGHGRRVQDEVLLLDLAPTLLARVGAPPDAGSDGRSLLGLLQLGPPGWAPRHSFALNNRRDMALRAWPDKLVRFEPGRGDPQAPPVGHLCFDLADDPGEDHPDREACPTALLEELEAFHAARIAQSDAVAPAPDNPALVRKLREQGYWGQIAPEGSQKPGEREP
ncbi:MAG: sulfatase-like hydrolase/transferase [Pseudomonadota bacterium]